MTAEEKFDRAHEILENAIKDLKKIGFTKYTLYASRPDLWLQSHESISHMGAASCLCGSASELIMGLAYMYGMMCKDLSREEMKVVRRCVNGAFDVAEANAEEHNSDNDDEMVLSSIKVSKEDAKSLTLEELIKKALEQVKDGDED